MAQGGSICLQLDRHFMQRVIVFTQPRSRHSFQHLFCGGGDNIASSAGGNLREYNRAVSAGTLRVAMINPPLFEMGLKMLDVDLH